MRFNLSDLEFKIKGSGNNAIFHPLYLQLEENNKVQAFIKFLEDNLNQKKFDIPFEVIWEIFPSEKISKALLLSSSRYYSFSSQTVKEILSIKTEDLNEKTQSGDLTEFLSSVDIGKWNIHNIEPSEIRSKIFQIVNKNPSGFVTTSKRAETVNHIEEQLEIPDGALGKLFFADIESEKILLKHSSVNPAQLIAYFNFDTIETILCFSIDLTIRLKKLPGYLAKNLVYVSKKNYVYSDISLEEDGYKITIEPPLELFREKGGWGKNIANVAIYVLRTALRESIEFQLQAVVKPRNRKALFLLNSSKLPILPSFKRFEEDNSKPEIDSKIEDRFLKTWKSFHGWKAIPEPEAIIIGRKMYVPDFILERGDKSVFLEIVGYYTMKYIQKKKAQMKELTQQEIPIIYLIDEELKTHFSELREISSFYYSGMQIPNNQLLKILEERYSDFEERYPLFIKEIEKICIDIKEVLHSISLHDIQRSLKAYSSEETMKILTSSEIREILSKSSILLLQSYGLVSEGIIETVRDFVLKKKTIPLNELKKEFPDFKDALIAICQEVGCKVKWKSIEEVIISTPTS